MNNIERSARVLLTISLYTVVFHLVVRSSLAVNYEWKLQMPAAQPNADEQYLCHAEAVEQPGFITKFVPVAQMSRVHHMIIFGCSKKFESPEKIWHCSNDICSGQSVKILYAWARNAPALQLPDSVGVSIGGHSTIDYVVLQVHYNLQFIGNVLDHSGVQLYLTTDEPLFHAGVFILAAGAEQSIPPREEKYMMNISCPFNLEAELHPFAYRTHAHALGRIITGYRYRQGEFRLIGKGNPQWPQLFYPTKDNFTLASGDSVAAQCVFNASTRDTVTNVGAHGLDEMCNFYMYYYVAAEYAWVIPEFLSCISSTSPEIFNAYPKEASIPLPSDDRMEKEAAMIHDRFGVTTDQSWTSTALKFGQIGGLTMDREDNLILFHRADRVWDENSFDELNRFRLADDGPIKLNVLAKMSPSGQVLKEWGADWFYLPHGAFVDHQNQLWLTDVAMHQVFRYSLDGDVNKAAALTLGTKMTPGSDEHSFCKPSAVSVSSQREVYIADGYCNDRVAQYTYEGKFVKSLRAPETAFGAPLAPVRLVHDVTVDENDHQLLMADRESGRALVFDLREGNNLTSVLTDPYLTGALYGLHFCSAGNVIFFLTGPLASGDKVESAVYVFDASSHALLYSFRPEDIPFERTHSITSNRDCNEVYIGLLSKGGVVKMTISAMGPPAPHATQPASSNGDQAVVPPPSSVHLKVDIGAQQPYSTVLLGAFGTFGIILIVLVTMIGCRFVLRRRQDEDNYRHPLLKNPKWKKGFQPLNTEDIDRVDYMSDDSEEREDLLYSNKNAPAGSQL